MNVFRKGRWLTGLALLGVLAMANAAPPTAPQPDRWEKDIQAFEAADRQNPPPIGAVLFVGSSGVRLWKTLATDFPEQRVINRGFGGSQIADATRYAERIIIPCKPRIIVLRAGGNDIHLGKSPQEVAADFQAFVSKIHAALPDTRILFLALSPSVARWKNLEQEKETNRLIEDFVRGRKNLAYVDTFTPMLGPDGKPRPEFYAQDQLHNSPEGYRVWTKILQPYLK